MVVVPCYLLANTILHEFQYCGIFPNVLPRDTSKLDFVRDGTALTLYMSTNMMFPMVNIPKTWQGYGTFLEL